MTPAAMPWHGQPHRRAHWQAYERRRGKYEATIQHSLVQEWHSQARRSQAAITNLWHHQGQPTLEQVKHVVGRYTHDATAIRTVRRIVGGVSQLVFRVEGGHAFALTKSVGRAIQGSQRQAEDDPADLPPDEPGAEDFSWRQDALAWLAQRDNMLTGVSDNRFDDIISAIGSRWMSTDYDGGSAAIARVLEEQFGFDPSRALLVARTETTSAAGLATLEGFKQGGAPYKGWLAVQDDRTRESHADTDGEVVGIDEDFSNGLSQPGDPDGPPEEVCNCRCTMTPEFEE